MNLEVYRTYTGRNIPKSKKVRIRYDKRGKERPAWIQINGLQKKYFSDCRSCEWKKNIL